jgi:hypothetical protein
MYPTLPLADKTQGPINQKPANTLVKVMEPDESCENLTTQQIYQLTLGLLRQLNAQTDEVGTSRLEQEINQKMGILKPRLVRGLQEKIKANPEFTNQIQTQIQQHGAQQFAELRKLTGQDLNISDIFNEMSGLFQQADMKQDLMLFMQMHTIKELHEVKEIQQQMSETQQQLLAEQKKTNELLGRLVGNMKQIDTSARNLKQIEQELAKQAKVSTGSSWSRGWLGPIVRTYNYVAGPAATISSAAQTYQNVQTAIKVAQTVASFGWIIALI